MKQLSLLEKIVEDPVLSQIYDLTEKQNNLRKGIFRRFDDLKKEVECLKEQLQEMKHPDILITL